MYFPIESSSQYFVNGFAQPARSLLINGIHQMAINVHSDVDAAVAQFAFNIFWMLTTPYWGKFNIQK